MIESQSETIGTKEQRELRNITHEIGDMLTSAEYTQIMTIYANAIERLLLENGEKIQ